MKSLQCDKNLIDRAPVNVRTHIVMRTTVVLRACVRACKDLHERVKNLFSMCIVIDINDQSCTLLLLRHCKFYRKRQDANGAVNYNIHSVPRTMWNLPVLK